MISDTMIIYQQYSYEVYRPCLKSYNEHDYRFHHFNHQFLYRQERKRATKYKCSRLELFNLNNYAVSKEKEKMDLAAQ